MKNLKYNIFFCVLTPTLIAGFVGSGFYYLFGLSLPSIYPAPLILFGACCISYLVGSLVRNNYKWKKEDKK